MDSTSCQVNNSLGLYNQVRDDGGLKQGVFRGGDVKWPDAGCKILNVYFSDGLDIGIRKRESL